MLTDSQKKTMPYQSQQNGAPPPDDQASDEKKSDVDGQAPVSPSALAHTPSAPSLEAVLEPAAEHSPSASINLSVHPDNAEVKNEGGAAAIPTPNKQLESLVAMEDANDANSADAQILESRILIDQYILQHLNLTQKELKILVYQASQYNNLYFLVGILPEIFPDQKIDKIELCEIGLSQAIRNNHQSVFDFWIGIRNTHQLRIHPHVFVLALCFLRHNWLDTLVQGEIDLNWQGSYIEFQLPKPQGFTHIKPLIRVLNFYKEKTSGWPTTQKVLAILHKGKATCDAEDLCIAVDSSLDDDTRLVDELIRLFDITAGVINTANKKGLTPLQVAKQYSLINVIKLLSAKSNTPFEEKSNEDTSTLVHVIEQFNTLHTEYTPAVIEDRIRKAFAYNQKPHLNKIDPYAYSGKYANLPAARALFKLEEEWNDTHSLKKHISLPSALIQSVLIEDKHEEKASDLLQAHRDFMHFALQKEEAAKIFTFDRLKEVARYASSNNNLYALKTILEPRLPNDNEKIIVLCEIGLTEAIVKNQSAAFEFWLNLRTQKNLTLPNHLINLAAKYLRLEMAQKLAAIGLDVNYQDPSVDQKFRSSAYFDNNDGKKVRAILFYIAQAYRNKKLKQADILAWIALVKTYIKQGAELASGYSIAENIIYGSENDNPEVLEKLCDLNWVLDLHARREHNFAALSRSSEDSGEKTTPKALLEIAATLGRTKIVAFLLTKLASKIKEFSYALVFALNNKHYEVALQLKNNGMEIPLVEYFGHRVGFSLTDIWVIILRNLNNDIQCEQRIDFLFDHFPELKKHLNEQINKNTIIYGYPEFRDGEKIELSEKFNSNSLFLAGLAAEKKLLKTLSCLIKYGASILEKGIFTTTSPALEAAINNNDLDFFKSVKASGTARIEAASFSPDSNLLLTAIRNSKNKPELIDALLTLFKFELQKNGEALVLAAELGYDAVVSCLIIHGAPVNAEQNGILRSPALLTAAKPEVKQEGQDDSNKMQAFHLLLQSHAIPSESKQELNLRAANVLNAVRLIRQNHFSALSETEGVADTNTTSDADSNNLPQLIATLQPEDLQNIYWYFQYTVQELSLRELLKDKGVQFLPASPLPHLIAINAESASEEQKAIAGGMKLNTAIETYLNHKNPATLSVIKLKIAQQDIIARELRYFVLIAVNNKDTSLLHCLFQAFRDKYPSCFDAMLNINMPGKAGNEQEALTFLDFATRNNDINSVTYLLQQPGIDIEQSKALFIAVQQANLEMALLLIANGARISPAILNNPKSNLSVREQKIRNYIGIILLIEKNGCDLLNAKSEVRRLLAGLDKKLHLPLFRYFEHSAWGKTLSKAYQELGIELPLHIAPPPFVNANFHQPASAPPQSQLDNQVEGSPEVPDEKETPVLQKQMSPHQPPGGAAADDPEIKDPDNKPKKQDELAPIKVAAAAVVVANNENIKSVVNPVPAINQDVPSVTPPAQNSVVAANLLARQEPLPALILNDEKHEIKSSRSASPNASSSDVLAITVMANRGVLIISAGAKEDSSDALMATVRYISWHLGEARSNLHRKNYSEANKNIGEAFIYLPHIVGTPYYELLSNKTNELLADLNKVQPQLKL